MLKIDRKTDVLLIVDFQKDFVSGSLAVPEAESLIPIINDCTRKFRIVIVSKDWHKENHPSFAPQGGPWPIHCVQNTPGAELHPSLTFPIESVALALILKGENEEAYSAFDRTTLDVMLKTLKTERLFICGLATDYCVKATVLDALKETKCDVFLLSDAVKAVNVNDGDDEKTIKEMVDSGAFILKTTDLEV